MIFVSFKTDICKIMITYHKIIEFFFLIAHFAPAKDQECPSSDNKPHLSSLNYNIIFCKWKLQQSQDAISDYQRH